jgi:hypothetical protein
MTPSRAERFARRPPGHRYPYLDGTGPARPDGARCMLEAGTACEPQHLNVGRGLVARPVERDDPPAAVAAAFLDPRRRRRGAASARKRLHASAASRALVPTSMRQPSCLARAMTVPGEPAVELVRRTPNPPWSAVFVGSTCQRTTGLDAVTGQKAKPHPRGGAGRTGGEPASAACRRRALAGPLRL